MPVNVDLNRQIVYSASLLTLLTGCGANFNSIYRSEKISPDTFIISDDAKQRVLIHKPATSPVTCLEPSPDALSAFASSFTGNISSPEKFAAALSGATSESAGSIGLRTQSIQLLRDQGFRICEGYANGALDSVDYSSMMRRNQAFTTAILAIEQLTGAVKAQQVILNTSAGAGGSPGLNEAQQQVAASQERVGVASKAVDEAKATADKSAKKAADLAKALQDGTPIDGKPVTQAQVDEAKAAANTDQATADKSAKKAADLANALQDGTLVGGRPVTKADVDEAVAAAKADKSALETKRNDLKNAETLLAEAKRVRDAQLQNVNASSGGTFGSSDARMYSADNVPEVVNNIVTIAFNKTFLTDFCQMYWAGSLRGVNASSSPRNDKICDMVLTDSLITNRALNGIPYITPDGNVEFKTGRISNGSNTLSLSIEPLNLLNVQ